MKNVLYVLLRFETMRRKRNRSILKKHSKSTIFGLNSKLNLFRCQHPKLYYDTYSLSHHSSNPINRNLKLLLQHFIWLAGRWDFKTEPSGPRPGSEHHLVHWLWVVSVRLGLRLTYFCLVPVSIQTLVSLLANRRRHAILEGHGG